MRDRPPFGAESYLAVLVRLFHGLHHRMYLIIVWEVKHFFHWLVFAGRTQVLSPLHIEQLLALYAVALKG